MTDKPKRPNARELVAALRQHPKLFQEVLGLMFHTCADCDGEGSKMVNLDQDPWLGLVRCKSCQGTGSLSPAFITHTEVSMESGGPSHPFHPFQPTASIQVSFLTSREGARSWLELLRRYQHHPLDLFPKSS